MDYQLSPTAPRALLFDLFGTLVHFAPRVPTVEVGWRSTMDWLREMAKRELPEVSFDDIVAALLAVTEEIIRQRPPEYREVPSRERFQRAIMRLGIDSGRVPAVARLLSEAHMMHLAAQTVVPPRHLSVLQAFVPQYRLALVSNFDHAPTARRILAEHGLTGFFHAILISEEFGRRKPHPAIFDAALKALGVPAAQAVFIGDSLADDIVGARNACLKVVWINRDRHPLPTDLLPPDYVIERLDQLPELLVSPES